MIGLSLRGKPVLGVVHVPALQTPKTYYAVADQGAFVLPGGEDQRGDGGLAGSERMRCMLAPTMKLFVLLSVASWLCQLIILLFVRTASLIHRVNIHTQDSFDRLVKGKRLLVHRCRCPTIGNCC